MLKTRDLFRTVDTINLRPGQDELVQKHVESIYRDSFFFNLSGTGSGKTITTTFAAAITGYRLFVIAPCPCIPTWQRMNSHVEVVAVLSYETLRGASSQPKHGYLRKIVTEIQTGKSSRTSISFKPTPKLHALTSQCPTMLVVDECHKTKNQSLQSLATAAMVQHFRVHGKVTLLSATPFDKLSHVVTAYRLLGIYKAKSLWRTNGDNQGFEEIVSYCNSINPEETRRILHSKAPSSLEETQKECLRLWVDVIAPRHVAAMSQKGLFEHYDENKDIANLHCNIDSTDHENGVNKLRSAVSYTLDPGRRPGDVGNRNNTNFKQLASALNLIEISKLPTLRRLIKHDLFFHPNSKIIVLCNLRCTIEKLAAEFAAFEPLRFEGGMSRKEEKRVHGLFQAPSLKYRLFFANFNKGGTGIDLHDTYGNFKRRMYIIPTYANPHQAVGRLFRVGIKSCPTIRFVYGREKTETKILECLMRKKEVMQKSLPQQVQDKVVFPGEYKSVVENDWRFIQQEMKEVAGTLQCVIWMSCRRSRVKAEEISASRDKPGGSETRRNTGRENLKRKRVNADAAPEQVQDEKSQSSLGYLVSLWVLPHHPMVQKMVEQANQTKRQPDGFCEGTPKRTNVSQFASTDSPILVFLFKPPGENARKYLSPSFMTVYSRAAPWVDAQLRMSSRLANLRSRLIPFMCKEVSDICLQYYDLDAEWYFAG